MYSHGNQNDSFPASVIHRIKGNILACTEKLWARGYVDIEQRVQFPRLDDRLMTTTARLFGRLLPTISH